jgi:hypothetical protein
MIKCNTATTSMSRTYRLSDFHFAPLTSDDATEYRNIVGGLQYLTNTHPDISNALNRVFSFFMPLEIPIAQL